MVAATMRAVPAIAGNRRGKSVPGRTGAGGSPAADCSRSRPAMPVCPRIERTIHSTMPGGQVAACSGRTAASGLDELNLALVPDVSLAAEKMRKKTAVWSLPGRRSVVGQSTWKAAVGLAEAVVTGL